VERNNSLTGALKGFKQLPSCFRFAEHKDLAMPSMSTSLDVASTVWSRILEDAVDDNNSTESKNGYEQDYGNGDGYYDEKKGPVPLDYSVLSIGILTLGLIFFVEATRHWFDHQAHCKPFFKAVLMTLYSECPSQAVNMFHAVNSSYSQITVAFCLFII
jgi:hypothetical protein